MVSYDKDLSKTYNYFVYTVGCLGYQNSSNYYAQGGFNCAIITTSKKYGLNEGIPSEDMAIWKAPNPNLQYNKYGILYEPVDFNNIMEETFEYTMPKGKKPGEKKYVLLCATYEDGGVYHWLTYTWKQI